MKLIGPPGDVPGKVKVVTDTSSTQALATQCGGKWSKRAVTAAALAQMAWPAVKAARSLATEYDLPTYYLPLGDIAKDSDLMQLVGGIKPRSVLLLEDVDSFRAATDRSDEKDHASVATLLNALDGVWTPHGLITIMTTNNREALDPTLIRAGRVDVDEELGNLDADQAERLAERLLPGGLTGAVDFAGKAPSELIEHIRNNT